MAKWVKVGTIELLEYGDGLTPDLSVHNIPSKVFKKLVPLGDRIRSEGSEWVKIGDIPFFKE